MWTFVQQTGELLRDGQHIEKGYSGCDEGKNNPSMQAVHDRGPIPQGEWKIVGPPINTPDHGPYVLRLTPAALTKTFGRGGFLMHGDSTEHPGCASKGCIIMSRATRERVWASRDTELAVVAAFEPIDLQASADA